MGYFDWTRLAFLLFVLAVLGALAQLGSPSANPRPLASEPPDGVTTEENPPAAEGGSHEPVEAAPGEDAVHAAFVDHGERGHHNGASVDDAPDAGPPVFYRPGGRPESDPVCGNLGRFPSSRTIVFPLPKEYLYSYEDTWGAPRPQGGHEGTDLMAPTGTAEYAVTDGTIVPVAGANGNGWNSLGGYAVMLEAAYSVGPVKEGDLFYYAHLDQESALEIGTRVRAGQVVGYAGDTGQGPEVTRGLFPPHLHLGWYDASGARSPVASGAMNPYPLLEWIKASGGAITGGSNARYCEAPQTAAPSESRWPASDSPGVSPDLDTGSNDPSPAVEGSRHQKVAPAKQEESAPNESSRDAPGKAAPKAAPPPDKPPRAPDGENSRDRSDAPIPEADPERDKANDHPEHKPNEDRGEEKGEDAKGAPKDRGEEPENKGPEEDPQSPDEQTSPDENQPPEPESDGEGSLETTTPAPSGSEDPGAEPDPESTTATPETTAAN